VIGYAATTHRATIIRQGRDMRIPDIAPLAAIVPAAAVLVVDVSAAALDAVTGRQRQLRRLTGKKPPIRVLDGGPATRRAGQDAHRVKWVRDAVHPNRAPRMLNLGLHTPAVPPG